MPFRTYLVNIILFLVLLGFGNFFINTISYFDASSLCYIAIDNDVLNGNQETIQDAIKLIKYEDEADYRTLCTYVDTIAEQECINFDPRVTKSPPPPPSACYIKGSKVIYLPNNSRGGEEIIRERADMIKKYSKKSREFWQGFGIK